MNAHLLPLACFAAACCAAALPLRAADAPADPYEKAERADDVLADDKATPPTLTLGTPLVRSATGWLLPDAGWAERLPDFRLTVDASADAVPGRLSDIERRVKAVEFLVPQSPGLWLGWELPETASETPRATFSIRSDF